MTAPYWHDAASTLYVGDALDVLAGMPDGSADCIVTSPPYWGKRDYDVARQYGREPSPAAYVGTLRAVFAEARRVPSRQRDMQAEPRRLLLRRRGSRHRDARLPRLAPDRAPGPRDAR